MQQDGECHLHTSLIQIFVLNLSFLKPIHTSRLLLLCAGWYFLHESML